MAATIVVAALLVGVPIDVFIFFLIFMNIELAIQTMNLSML
jgi:hypothetical protein